LQYQLNTTGIAFTVAANHLNSEISQTHDYQLLRKINATNTNTITSSNSRGGGGRGGNSCSGGGCGRTGRGGCGGPNKTSYYYTAEWEKLSYKERNKVREERDKKGEQGGTKRSISELTTKQLTTAIISSIRQATKLVGAKDDTTSSKTNSQAGNAFGGKESAKRNKTE
jgi:hypothetical protein